MLTLDSALTSALSPWAERLRAHANLPVLLRWSDDPGSGLKLGHFDAPRVQIRIRQPAAVPALLSPSLDRLGEAYVEGRIDLTGSAQDLMDVAWRMSEAGAQGEAGPDHPDGPVARLLQRIAHATLHTPEADREAIHYHYDVSNAFYAEWLDPAMVYSCAYFEQGNESLAQAQLRKIDHILTKLRVQPGHRLLDIGCGWGALVMRAAAHFGAHCVGVTLSQNQYELARERVREAGLSDRIEIRLQDYREVTGPFDRITSVGMFEHVGLKHLAGYFRRLHDLLAPDGWALNHGITSTDANDGETHYGGGRFIDRYVFPQGELPHIGTVLKALQEGGLEAVDVEGLRRHYARTLQLWSETFEAKGETLKAMVDEKRWRIWRVYLVGSQWAFEHDQISLYQVLCRRAGRSAREQPWSRGWMYGRD
jgi:cyclopropane-fatty-acyl-phospholipid synthase